MDYDGLKMHGKHDGPKMEYGKETEKGGPQMASPVKGKGKHGGYVSAAQRKAKHATDADGGKGNPNNPKMYKETEAGGPKMKSGFKMKGSPFQRNFGIGASPVKAEEPAKPDYIDIDGDGDLDLARRSIGGGSSTPNRRADDDLSDSRRLRELHADHERKPEGRAVEWNSRNCRESRPRFLVDSRARGERGRHRQWRGVDRDQRDCLHPGQGALGNASILPRDVEALRSFGACTWWRALRGPAA